MAEHFAERENHVRGVRTGRPSNGALSCTQRVAGLTPALSTRESRPGLRGLTRAVLTPIVARMRGAKVAGWMLLGAVLSGCVMHPYSRTSAVAYPPKPANCPFRMSTAGQVAGYEEIGTIGGCSGTNDLNSYREQIQSLVCQNGGDLVVVQVNGHGVFCLGTVFRQIQQTAATP
jgi:hypothetical protein